MLHAYINYPNPHLSIHGSASCGNIQQQHKSNQRVVKLNRASFSAAVVAFAEKQHQFGSDASTNDMWLVVDFEDDTFEPQVVEYIRQLLARHYSPFARVTIDRHCS
jgi:hypothetical protein